LKTRYPNMTIRLTSNGTMLNDEKSRMVCKLLKSKDTFLVSLNSGSAATYARLNRADKFDLVVSNIQDFLKVRNELRSGPRLVIQILQSRLTSPEIEDFKKLWDGSLCEGDSINVKRLGVWGGEVDVEDIALPFEINRYPCHDLWTTVVVDVHGNVYPCCVGLAFRENSGGLLLGNIREKSLRTIYSEDKIKQKRNSHLKGRWSDTPACSQCQSWASSPNVWLTISGRWL